MRIEECIENSCGLNQANEISAVNISAEKTNYAFQGIPGRQYRIGVQKVSCFGVSAIVWSEEYCETSDEGNFFSFGINFTRLWHDSCLPELSIVTAMVHAP